MKRRTRSGKGGEPAQLLDTSTLLWALGDPQRLPPRVRTLLESGRNVLSVVSYWEVVIKTQKGLLVIPELGTWWKRATDELGARILSVQASHVAALAALPQYHRDPFDRMLIAQAIAEGLHFVSSDKSMSAYPVSVVW